MYKLLFAVVLCFGGAAWYVLRGLSLSKIVTAAKAAVIRVVITAEDPEVRKVRIQSIREGREWDPIRKKPRERNK